MTTVVLRAAGWRSTEDVYQALLQALGAPDWHGHNLDALEESLRSADINRVIPPLHLQIDDVSPGSTEAQVTVLRILGLLHDLHAEGLAVTWSIPTDAGAAEAIDAMATFRRLALEKGHLIDEGDARRDSALHAKMGRMLRTLFGLGSAGNAAIDVLLHDPSPSVSSWVASELASRGEKRGVDVLARIAAGRGLSALGARTTLEQLEKGALRSPFGLDAA